MTTNTSKPGQKLDQTLALFNRMAPIVRAGLVLTCLVLPLSSLPAESRADPLATERLEWMLATHDVRQVIHAPAKTTRDSDCPRNKSEHAR